MKRFGFFFAVGSAFCAATGCQTTADLQRHQQTSFIAGSFDSAAQPSTRDANAIRITDARQTDYFQQVNNNVGSEIANVAFQEPVEESESNSEAENGASRGTFEFTAPPNTPLPPQGSLTLETVLTSTINNYPEIQAAFQAREIAAGGQLAAQGGFDRKFKLDSENTPVGFYETYRNKVGLEIPTFNGGSIFGGYRLGRGDFEPWYLERNTNAGGEFKFGFQAALARGRDIDQRRADLWRANWQQRAAEPEIQASLIQGRQLAEFTYWSWVAAGQVYQLNRTLLEFAEKRQDGIKARVDADDIAPISQTDNDRSIVSRRAKLIEARAKFEQAAAKLSLFYRDANGVPIIPTEDQLPEFPNNPTAGPQSVDQLVSDALGCRPDIQLIDIELSQLQIDLAQAQNNLLPKIDFQAAVSQDIGDPTSASAAASSSGAVFANFDEKDEFKVDVSLFVDQSLERRKARGKLRSLFGKRTQLLTKRAFLEEKIRVEIEQLVALLVAAEERIEQAAEARRLTQELASGAREFNRTGDADIFQLILREQQEIDAANQFVDAILDFYISRANLNAAVGCGFQNGRAPVVTTP